MTFVSALLTENELMEMRQYVEDTVLPQTCSIYGRSNTNTKGSQEVTLTLLASDVKCRIYADQRENSRSYRAGEVMSTMTEWILTLPYDQEIYNGCIVVHEGESYEVVGVYDAPSFKVANRVDMVRLHVDQP